MSCRADGLTRFDDALAVLLASTSRLGAETVPLLHAQGRCLAAPIQALRDRPAFPLAAMDGYAIRDADSAALQTGLGIAGAAYPGAPYSGLLPSGQAIRVTTGARVPLGADRVVVDEAVERCGETIRLVGPGDAKTHIRPIGAEVRAGGIVLPIDLDLTPLALMAAAAADCTTLSVVRRPRVAILATGEEIAPAGAPASEAQTPDSVSIAVSALVTTWGGEVVAMERCGDDGDDLFQCVARLKREADILVVVGGASHSERDYSREAVSRARARLLFAGVAMKPGKPVWAATAPGCTMLGLPGNPVAAMITARLFLAPLVSVMGGRSAETASAWRGARTLQPLPAGGGADGFLIGRLDDRGVEFPDKSASPARATAALNCLVRRRPACLPVEAGEYVTTLPF